MVSDDDSGLIIIKKYTIAALPPGDVQFGFDSKRERFIVCIILVTAEQAES